jgi:hypothetical protein
MAELERYHAAASALRTTHSRFHLLPDLPRHNREEAADAFNAVTAGIAEELESALVSAEDDFVIQAAILRAKGAAGKALAADMSAHLRSRFISLVEHLSGALDSLNSTIDSQAQLIDALHERYVEDTAALRTVASRSEGEARALLEAAELLEEETLAYAEERRQIEKRHEEEKNRLTEEIGWLRAENDRMLAQMRAAGAAAGEAIGSPAMPKSSVAAAASASRRLRASGLASASTTPRRPRSAQLGPSPGSSAPVLAASGSAAAAASLAASHNALASETVAATAKTLSLKVLRDMISEILESKAKYDQRCVEGKLPRETMLQHLYTFLNQKYGLKPLIVEWSNGILHAVKRYRARPDCPDVLAFSRILLSEIDEEFWLVLDQVRATVKELLRVYIRVRFPILPESEVESRLTARVAGKVNVKEAEWVDVVRYMYQPDDAVELIARVKRAAAAAAAAALASPAGPVQGRVGRARSDSKSVGKIAVPYQTLVDVLLGFQLEGHCSFLARFHALFQQFDSDADGVLGEEEFRGLYDALALGASAAPGSERPQDVDDVLLAIDPNGHGRLTFSECVAALATLIAGLNRTPLETNSVPPTLHAAPIEAQAEPLTAAVVSP